MTNLEMVEANEDASARVVPLDVSMYYCVSH